MIDLDFNLADAGEGRSQGQQAGEGRLTDDDGLASTTKSSAVSVWILPGLDGRERVAIFPSGLPVEKEKGVADA